MKTLLRAALIILVLVAALFLLGLLYWLYACLCGRDLPGFSGRGERAEIVLQQAVASVWDESQTIGVQAVLINEGARAAPDLRISSVSIEEGAFAGPDRAQNPGDLAPGGNAAVDAVFKLATPADGRPRRLVVEGSYRGGLFGRRRFTAEGSVNPDAAPPNVIFSTPGVMTKQRPDAVAYPPAQPAPGGEGPNAETPILIPIGPPRTVFPPTPQGTEPGAVSAGAPVVIPVNTPTGTGIGTPPDPNAAAGGGVVMSTYNTSVMLSTDGGASFTNIPLFSPDPSNPARTTFFPQSDGGLCCDQVVVYLERQNLFVWLLQYNPITDASRNITQSSRLRIAFATPEAIRADMWNAWTYGDLSAISRPGISSGLGIGANEWLDYPDLAWSDEFLYVGVDRGWPDGFGSVYGGRRLVARLRLSDMADTSSGVIRYDFAELTGSAGLNKGHFVQDAPGRMVLGSLDNSSRLRIYTWPDGSGSISNSTVGITQIQTGPAYTSLAPDGSNWVGVGFPGNISGATFRRVVLGRGEFRDEYLFAFTAGRNGAGRPQPFVRLETLTPRRNGYNLIAEYDVWNGGHAYAMASLGSIGSDVGMTLGVGGGSFGTPQQAVGFKDDFAVYTVTNSTATQMVRYGDYFSTRRVPGKFVFGTEVYDIILNPLPPGVASGTCATVGCTANVRYVEFGRGGAILE